MIEVLKKTPLLRVVCFFLILIGLVIPIQNVLLYRDRKTDNSSYQIVNFYKEEKDSAEMVFIGSSCCFSFYSPLFAYNGYGVKTINYSSSGMGMIAFKYAIEEVKKSQPDAPIAITITPLVEMNYTALHYLADYMPWSINKLNFIKAYFSQGDESILNSVEYFFPLMRFHERWSTLTLDDLILDDGTKGATRHEYFLNYINDLSDYFVYSDERVELPEDWKYMMSDLLDYCDENQYEVSFIIPPITYKDDEYMKTNSLVDYIRSRNYEVLDLRDKLDEIHLDPTQDFYDIKHTNVHGSIKYTDYLINHFIDKYNLETGIVDDGYASAYNTYFDKIKCVVLAEETDMKHRDYTLARPSLEAKVVTDKVTISWNNVENANGYCVYRKENGTWNMIGETQENSFTDENVTQGLHTYTVISYRKENDAKFYGNYEYRGIEVEVVK